MLVLKVHGDYKKKATGISTFSCDQGSIIKQAVQEAVANNEARTVTLNSIGRNEAGEVVAEFKIEWTFKLKTPAKVPTSPNL